MPIPIAVIGVLVSAAKLLLDLTGKESITRQDLETLSPEDILGNLEIDLEKVKEEAAKD